MPFSQPARYRWHEIKSMPATCSNTNYVDFAISNPCCFSGSEQVLLFKRYYSRLVPGISLLDYFILFVIGVMMLLFGFARIFYA